MKLTETAAAYGLFHVVFADLTEHLQVALYQLNARREQGVEFANSPWKFSEIITKLRKELDATERNRATAEPIDKLRSICQIACSMADWRNRRAHARVRLSEEGYALYDSRTGNRLEISVEALEGRIQEMITANLEIEFYVRDLTGELDSFEHMIRLLHETSPGIDEDVDGESQG